MADSISALEQVAALGWPAPDTTQLGGWLLRAGGGWTGRANSVLPLGDPDRPLDAALTEVCRWYADRNLPARFQVPLPLRTDLDDALAERGWRAYNRTTVRVAGVDNLLAAAGPDRLAPVTLATAPSEEWLSAYHYRGGADLPPVAVQIMTAAADPIFATAVVDGELAGVGRAVVDVDGAGVAWCGITALETVPGLRRRGVGRHLVRALVAWAAGRGASRVYLQVMEDNVAAHAMYEGLGCTVSHVYQYRTPA